MLTSFNVFRLFKIQNEISWNQDNFEWVRLSVCTGTSICTYQRFYAILSLFHTHTPSVFISEASQVYKSQGQKKLWLKKHQSRKKTEIEMKKF